MKEQVLKYLREKDGLHSPTQIGMALGKDYNTASSSVSHALKSLVKEGKVKRKQSINVFYHATHT